MQSILNFLFWLPIGNTLKITQLEIPIIASIEIINHHHNIKSNNHLFYLFEKIYISFKKYWDFNWLGRPIITSLRIVNNLQTKECRNCLAYLRRARYFSKLSRFLLFKYTQEYINNNVKLMKLVFWVKLNNCYK